LKGMTAISVAPSEVWEEDFEVYWPVWLQGQAGAMAVVIFDGSAVKIPSG